MCFRGIVNGNNTVPERELRLVRAYPLVCGSPSKVKRRRPRSGQDEGISVSVSAEIPLVTTLFRKLQWESSFCIGIIIWNNCNLEHYVFRGIIINIGNFIFNSQFQANWLDNYLRMNG